MNKRILVSIAFVCAFVASQSEAISKKPWTFFVYIAGDNNLADYAALDLNEMMKVGSNANVHIVVHATVKPLGKPKKTTRYEVLPGSLKQIGATTVEDSGSVQSFTNALEWAHVNYPSDRLMVVLWDHGSGTLNPGRSPSCLKGICWDDTTGHFLSDRDCYSAFEYVCTKYRDGKKIDIVACDACLMASLEVAHTFKKYVDYFVASEENIPGYGFQYAYALAPFKTGAPSSIDLAKSLVKAYDDCYKASGLDYTLSALDLKQLDPLVTNLNKISKFFITQLKSSNKKTVKKALAETITLKAALHFGGENYLDLYQWLSNVNTAVPTMMLSTKDTRKINDLVNATLPLVTKPVLARCNSKDYNKSYGMTIYFPATSLDSSYNNLLWMGLCNWPKFLKAFIAA